MKKNNNIISRLLPLTVLMLPLLFAAVSCGSAQKYVYLNDMTPGEKYPFEAAHEALIQPGDRVSVTVSCKQPELAIPFNIRGGAVNSATGEEASSAESAGENGYKVSRDGEIDFPILGQVKLSGLTRAQAEAKIRDMIVEGDYIKSPIVNIEFLNFKYTVWGAISRNGTYTDEDGRVTILEAIANAGDLTNRARLDRVAVIREVDGNKVVYFNDLRSSSILESPCFFLQQNDIVYVQPKYGKKDREDRTIQYTTMFLTFVTSVCSAIWAVNSTIN